MEIIDVYDASVTKNDFIVDKRTIYSVQVNPGIHVDVMHVHTNDLVYVMQNEDGSMMRDAEGNFIQRNIDTKEIEAFVRNEIFSKK